MTTREEAAEQLRVIRSVMERATVFRALSGETALIGGAAALAAAWLSEGRDRWAWAAWWLGGLAVVLAFNVFQIFRVQSSTGRPFWSQGLKVALRGIMPSLIAGGFIGLLFVRWNQEVLAACIWIVHYGVALLAIREFAPKSMGWLGWSFVVAGIIGFAGVTDLLHPLTMWMVNAKINASHLMAVTFGAFHLIYGALIVTTNRREDTAP